MIQIVARLRSSAAGQSILSWLRQSTTSHGIALLVISAVAHYLGGMGMRGVLSLFAGGLTLLILPGQGDLAGKISRLAGDTSDLVAQRGSTAAVNAVISDGLAIEGAIDPAAAALLAPATAAETTSAAGGH